MVSLQYTVAIVKPHAIPNRIKIVQFITDAGIRIIGERYVEINADEAWFLCKDEEGKVLANSQTEAKMQSLLGTAIVLLLTHERALELMNEIIGPADPAEARKTHPKSLRGKFGSVSPYNVLVVSGNERPKGERALFIFTI